MNRRCPDCWGFPRERVSNEGHRVLNGYGVLVLLPHSGCPECRHSEEAHSADIGCWSSADGPICTCNLGPDGVPARLAS